MKLTQLENDILSRISDDAGTTRAPIDGMREVAAARRLESKGFGRFVPETDVARYHARNKKAKPGSYTPSGHFYLTETDA